MCITDTFAAEAIRPSRKSVDSNIDPEAQVYAHYAVVRLPLTRGATLWNPSTIQFSPTGEPFGLNYTGEVYRLLDSDGDGLEDTAAPFCDIREAGSKTGTALAFRDGELLVGANNAILAYRDVDGDGRADQSRTFLKLPHGGSPYDWIFGMQFGPDGNLYAALATDSYYPMKSSDPLRWRGALLSITPDGSTVTVLATGLRFPYGLAFTGNGDLYFTDNEGGGNPTEELNRFVKNEFYGHNPQKFGNPRSKLDPIAPLREGRGCTGIVWNGPSNDFDGSGDCLFVAYFGKDPNWQEGTLSRMRLIRLPDGSLTAREEAVIRNLPKPTGLTFSPSGDLYVASYGVGGANNQPGAKPSGGYYRIMHAPWISPSPPPQLARLHGNAVHGGTLFTNLGCSTCHSVVPGVGSFGPNLAGLGETFYADEVMFAITNPAASVRTGFEAYHVGSSKSEDLVGWIVTSDTNSVTLQVASDRQVAIPRTEITEITALTASLMPESLWEGRSKADADDLMAFLGVPRRPGPPWNHRVYREIQKVLPGLRIRTLALISAGVMVVLSAAAWMVRQNLNRKKCIS